MNRVKLESGRQDVDAAGVCGEEEEGRKEGDDWHDENKRRLVRMIFLPFGFGP